MSMSSKLDVQRLRDVVRNCPLIDNHAHNILRPAQLKTYDLRTSSTEAHGAALDYTVSSLSHLRAARQLRELYGLGTDADWHTISEKRIELIDHDFDRFARQCFQGIQTVLIDDGLGRPEDLETFSWHDQFTLSPCKRIVRIETVAADLLSVMYDQGQLPTGVAIADEEACALAWAGFVAAFELQIAAFLSDPNVVGFKSVVCYRSGLDVQTGSDIEVAEAGSRAFRRHYLPSCKVTAFRVGQKGLNDALVISTCKLIAASHRQTGRAKPLQFHTGLGDTDISLLRSNPAYLQPLIEAFPTVPIVLLHSSYPYTREAGYLATHFSNVYLDIGEVFPMVSRDGQEHIVRQALELTPTTRILWSTDGHHVPETYYLAALQSRQAIETVLVDYVEHGDLSLEQAIEAVQDMLYNNSNKLYGLELPDRSMDANVDTSIEAPSQATHTTLSSPAQSGTIVKSSMAPSRATQNLVSLDMTIELYLVQWIDYLGTLRVRCIPAREFQRLAVADTLRFAISRGNLGTLQNDGITPVVHPIGQIMVHPDLTSIRKIPKAVQLTDNTATVMASFYTEERKPHPMCPRRTLSSAINSLKHDFGISTRLGFEIEVTFCRRGKKGQPGDPFLPLDSGKAWSTFSDEQYLEGFELMITVQKALAEAKIHVQHMHSESGAGQYEFVLPPTDPITAIDTLYQARQIIQQLAAKRGLRATYYPVPFHGVGTGAHAHISLRSHAQPDELEIQQMSFMAGVLSHLPAICAFTLPEAASYERVKDDIWTGGTWIAYGTQNREVPLRRIADSERRTHRWELRCLDGMSNMYLAIGAVYRAGLLGLTSTLQMTQQDCHENPARMTAESRASVGIVNRLPTSLHDSLTALEKDSEYSAAVGQHIVSHYLSMKRAEQDMLGAMSVEDRRVWLLERY